MRKTSGYIQGIRFIDRGPPQWHKVARVVKKYTKTGGCLKQEYFGKVLIFGNLELGKHEHVAWH